MTKASSKTTRSVRIAQRTSNFLDFFDILGVERVQMVKNRDIKGALASDHALREVVEKRVLVLIKSDLVSKTL